MKLIIPGLLPGLNEYINAERRNKHAAATMKKQVEHIIIIEAKRQIRRKLKTPVMMTYKWVEPNRKRDKDNISFARKFIQDSLVKAGILENDGWAQIEGFSDIFDVDKHNPRVEIEIGEGL